MTLVELQYVSYGLAIGLLWACAVWVLGWWRQRGLRAEVKQLKNHLHTQMEINHAGNSSLNDELNSLRKQNENLRVTVKTLEQKPGRREIRQLHVYDHAVHQLLAKAPGFSAAWEGALKEAEGHHEQVDTGLFAFARRMILPTGRSSTVQLDSSDSSDSSKEESEES